MNEETQKAIKQIMTSNTPKPQADMRFYLNSIQLCSQGELNEFNFELQKLMDKYRIIKIINAEWMRIPPQGNVAKG